MKKRNIFVAALASLSVIFSPISLADGHEDDNLPLGMTAEIKLENHTLDLESSGDIDYGSGAEGRSDTQGLNLVNVVGKVEKETKLGDMYAQLRKSVSGDGDVSSNVNCNSCNGETKTPDADLTELEVGVMADTSRYMMEGAVNATWNSGAYYRWGSVDIDNTEFRDTTISGSEYKYWELGGVTKYTYLLNSTNSIAATGKLFYFDRNFDQKEDFHNGFFGVNNTYGWNSTGFGASVGLAWMSEITENLDFELGVEKSFDISDSCDLEVSSNLANQDDISVSGASCSADETKLFAGLSLSF